MTQLQSFGANLRQHREAQRRSIETIAHFAGMWAKRLQAIENGQCKSVTLSEVFRLSEVLGIKFEIGPQ